MKQLCEEFGLQKEREAKNRELMRDFGRGSIKLERKKRNVQEIEKDNNTINNEEKVEEGESETDVKSAKNNDNNGDEERSNILEERIDDKIKIVKEKSSKTEDDSIKQHIAYAEEVCLVTPLDVESENCSNMSVHPVDICSVNVEINTSFYQNSERGDLCDDAADENEINADSDNLVMSNSDLIKSSDTSYSDVSSTANCTSESLTSSVSTPDTVVSKIPRRKTTPSRIPISPARIAAANNHSSGGNNNNNNNTNSSNNNNNNNKDVSNGVQDTKIPKSKIPHKSNKSKLKVSYILLY